MIDIFSLSPFHWQQHRNFEPFLRQRLTRWEVAAGTRECGSVIGDVGNCVIDRWELYHIVLLCGAHAYEFVGWLSMNIKQRHVYVMMIGETFYLQMYVKFRNKLATFFGKQIFMLSKAESAKNVSQ